MKAFYEKIFPLDSSSFQIYLYENEEFDSPRFPEDMWYMKATHIMKDE